MARLTARILTLGFVSLIVALWYAPQSQAYTLTDWMRSWPGYYGGQAAPPPVIPAAPPAYAAPPYVSPGTPAPGPTTPLPACPPAAATAPSLATPQPYTPPTGPTYTPAAPSCAAPAPVYTPPAAPSCGAPGPIYTPPAGPSCAAPAPAYTPPPAYTPAPGCAARSPSCGASPIYSAAPSCGASPVYNAAPSCGASPVYGAAPSCGVSPSSASAASAYPTRTVSYQTETRYRTTWVRVPTTNYRPVPTYNAALGGTTTVMKPCTTYTWQARRVPTGTTSGSTAGCGLFSGLFRGCGLFGPSTPPPPTPQPVPVYTTPGCTTPPPSSSCTAYCTSRASVPMAPSAMPYTPPAPSSGSSAPVYGSPAPTSGSPAPVYGSPGPTYGSPAPGGGTQGVPADQQPTLTPGDAQGIQPVPEFRGYTPMQSGGAVTRQKVPAVTPNSGTGGNSSTPVPLTDPTPDTPVKPVPDLDAANGRKQTPATPSLFDPRDRTASVGVRRAWAVSAIIWPDDSQPVEARTVTAQLPIRLEQQSQPQTQVQPVSDLTDDGWRTVGP